MNFSISVSKITMPLLSATLRLVVASTLLYLPAAALAQDDAAPQTREELEEQIKQALEVAPKQMEEGDYEGAAASYSFVLKRTGGQDPRIKFQRARALKELKEYEAALDDIKEAMSYGNAVAGLEAEARNLRAEIRLEQGAPDAALRDAQKAVQEDRNNPKFQYNLGKALIQLGSAVAGEKAISKYIATDDQNPESFRLRAQAFAGMRKYEKSLADIDRAIELDPEDHENYYTKGIILVQDEQMQESSEAMRMALEKYVPQDPDSPLPYVQAHLTRASILEEIGKKADDPEVQNQAFQEQKQECETLLDALPDSPAVASSRAAALFRLGVAERLLENLADAVKAFTDAIDLNPGLSEAYFRRGICFYYLNEPRLALADFDQGAALDTASPRSNLWRGRCQNSMGEHREAIKAFSDAIAVADRYTTAYVHRGLTYLQIGDNERAVKDFNTAIRLEPTVGNHYYLRGVAFNRQGNTDRAIDSLTNAIKFDTELVEAYDLLGRLLQRTGRGSLANEYRRKAGELRTQQGLAPR